MENERIIRNKKAEKITSTMIVVSLVFLAGTLSGCTGANNSFDWRKPVSLDINPPEGPKNYQQGWQDGCTSGLASTNTSLHLAMGSYSFTLDKNLRYDHLYNKAWQYGYNHCGYSMKSLAQYSF
ncbi:hypothetical protein N9W34_07095 [Rickettsiales bacterium]|nr:hypothetical protein [Rickettsiales bacterium]